MAVINQFESEDAYWEYEFEVYRKSLPIQNYVKSLEMTQDELEAVKQQAVQNERYVNLLNSMHTLNQRVLQ